MEVTELVFQLAAVVFVLSYVIIAIKAAYRLTEEDQADSVDIDRDAEWINSDETWV